MVGGGVIGAACAFALAREGLAVTLLERDALAAHASGAAAGMLAPIGELEREPAALALGLSSLALFPALVRELGELSGIDPQHATSGILRVARSEEEARTLAARARELPDLGLEWLDAAAARELEPALAPQLHGALLSPREGQVASALLVRALARAAGRLGARIETGAPVHGLVREGTRVRGVRTAAGERPCRHVVLCAGAWTPAAAAWLDSAAAPAIEPVRGQILALDPVGAPPRHVVWGGSVYLVPRRDGSLVVGATEEHVGFDCRTTAQGVGELLAAAPRLVPGLAAAGFRGAWAGLRPATPDRLPLVGPWPGAEGLVLAAGHHRSGVLLAPRTAQLVADCVLGKELPAEAHLFRPERFLAPR